jgi:1-acyl-sn-glycerol-3-phosphate acyltransferase
VVSGAQEDRKTVEPEITHRLLQLVRDLVLELHPHMRRTVAVELGSDLDRDLGLDSLGRAELILRIDRTFKVRLPDRLIGEADTPADLLAALREAAPVGGLLLAAEPIAEAGVLPEVLAPLGTQTLIEALAFHVERHANRPHIFLWQGEAQEQCITYGDLDRAARAIAHGLLQMGLAPGDRVAIMLPTEAAFFEAFYGVLYAGGVPVPIYPPFRRAQVEDHLRRQAGILRNAGARALIVGSEIRNLGTLLFGLAVDLRHVETVAALSNSGSLEEPLPAGPETVALIQYTSGSTGDPKGVVLTHANLLANIRAMGEAIEASSADVFVSWLPLYHDMGLIGAWLGTLYYGAPTIIMPPLAFLADPGRWLRAIARHRATLSAAPNFAFELCCKNVRDEDMQGFDLSSLRMVVNGAEPVSPTTIARFTKRFSKLGIRPEAMAPVYGLAENSVGLAFPPVGRVPIIDRVERLALSRDGKAIPARQDDATALEFVACGRPIPRHEIRIVDDASIEVPDRTEGRLQFKGPSATKGYFRNPQKTRALFDGEWLESDDRAYIANGDVFITGRIKDIIIKAGRNIYPHELEEVVGNVEGVRKGCVAAFPTMDEQSGTERLIVLAETRLTDPAAIDEMKRRIAEAATALLDLPPDEVLAVPPRTVPKTSSGKIRRSAARVLYENGALAAKGRALWWQLTRLAVSSFGVRLRRAWHLVTEYAFAAYWWTLLVTIAACVWLLVLLLPRRSWRQSLIHHAARAFLWLAGSAPIIESEGWPPRSNIILISNHSSYLDSAVIAAAFPGPLSFVAKQELAPQRIAGPFLRRIGTIFARRTDTAGGIEDTRHQLEAVRSGERVVSFPEGTLARMPGLLGFQLGAFLVAAEAQVPVIPITIRGTRSILRGGQWFPRRGQIRVHIGQAMAPDGTDFNAAIRLRDKARAEMLQRCGEPDLAYEKVDLEIPPAAGASGKRN